MPELAGRTESFVSTQNPRSSVFIGGQIMDLRGWFMTVYLYWPPMNTDERGFLDLLAEQLLGAGVLESGAGSRPDVKSWRGPPPPAEYASVKVGVSLESDSHDAPAGASQSIQHSSASTARVAIQRCAVLPRGRRLSLSGSPGKTPVRHAPVRASMPGKNRPYSRPTSPRETDTRASQERLASSRLGIGLRSA